MYTPFVTISAGEPLQGLSNQTLFIVTVATTGDQTLTGLATIDGIPVLDGTPVLVWRQTNPIENGVYLARTGAWERAFGFGGSSLNLAVLAGFTVYTQRGTLYGQYYFTQLTPDVNVGSDPIVFSAPWGPPVRSDATEFEIKASAAFTTTYAYSSVIDVRDFTNIDVYVEVTDKGSNTQFSVIAQTSGQAIPTQWSDLVSDDDIVDGATTPEPYVATFDISTDTAPFRKALNFPKRGPNMRIGVLAPSATGTFVVYCVRNTGN
jgi:hypothetical protein